MNDNAVREMTRQVLDMEARLDPSWAYIMTRLLELFEE